MEGALLDVAHAHDLAAGVVVAVDVVEGVAVGPPAIQIAFAEGPGAALADRLAGGVVDPEGVAAVVGDGGVAGAVLGATEVTLLSIYSGTFSSLRSTFIYSAPFSRDFSTHYNPQM